MSKRESMDEHTHDHHNGHEHARDGLRILSAPAGVTANSDTAATQNSREHTLDLAAVRAKLQSKTGKQYWRSLEELAEDPHFQELLQREFPRQAPSEWDEGVDRRDFLKLMAASLAFAGLSGCGLPPRENVVPYVKQPEGLTLGKPLFFATVMPFGADAVGVLVKVTKGVRQKLKEIPTIRQAWAGRMPLRRPRFSICTIRTAHKSPRALATCGAGRNL